MNKLRTSVYIYVFNLVISMISSRVILFSMFITYVLSGGALNAYKVYLVVSVIGAISFDLTWFFPDFVSCFYQVLVSCKRMQVVSNSFKEFIIDKIIFFRNF